MPRREPRKRRYALLKTPDWRHPYWMEQGDGRWVNANGGYFPATGREQVLEWAEAEDYRDLDHEKTGLYLDADPDSFDGWCGPDGSYHPCDYNYHDTYADLILKHTVGELEALGWARCHANGSAEPSFHLADGRRLTAGQRNTLAARGFVVREDD